MPKYNWTGLLCGQSHAGNVMLENKQPTIKEHELYLICGINIYKALSGLCPAAGHKEDHFLAGQESH